MIYLAYLHAEREVPKDITPADPSPINCFDKLPFPFFFFIAAHRQRNFLFMVAMHDYYYCIITGASPLQHKDKVPAEGTAH